MYKLLFLYYGGDNVFFIAIIVLYYIIILLVPVGAYSCKSATEIKRQNIKII